MTPPANNSSCSVDQVLDQLVAEITDKVQAGDAVDLDDFIQDYPEHADQMKRLLPSIQALAALGLSGSNSGLAAPAGDDAAVPRTVRT